MTNSHKSILTNVIRVTCFAVGSVCVLALGTWLLFQFSFRGVIPKWIMLRACMWLAEVGSLVLFFRRPWIMALVGWLTMALITTRIFPWEEPGLQNFFFQFMFDIAFFIAGNISAFVKIIYKPSITNASTVIS